MQSTSSESARRPDQDDRPVGELVKQLSEQTSTLVRKELELARAEMTHKGKPAGIGGHVRRARASSGCSRSALSPRASSWR